MQKLLTSKKWCIVVCSWFVVFLLLPTTNYQLLTTNAAENPLAVPNNKFGIHLIQATSSESSPAASLVNTNGDWGYVTIVVESKDRNKEKWQQFFNDLRRRHLIPIIRLATSIEGNYWKVPYEGEEIAWADFLNSLNWPTKNRYIVVYNEPNHSKEWGGTVDARSYARVLNKTIDALKNKSADFFVLNAGLDASAPQQLPNYSEEATFLKEMQSEIPGIFDKLDGWVSHSYPNPGFAGSPEDEGRGTVGTWFWELQQLRSLGITDDLPVFITETGWKHSEGLKIDPNLPSSEIIAKYYQEAFSSVWTNSRIVAVTPFLLTYQEAPFDHFSFKKLGKEEYYLPFETIKNMDKSEGKPLQINSASLVRGEVFKSIVAGENYDISLTFKNTGQSIWGDDSIKLVVTEGSKELGVNSLPYSKDIKTEPGQEYIFKFAIKAPAKGNFKTVFNLYSGQKVFDSPAVGFFTEVKSPVILQVKTGLKWRKIVEGDYILLVEGAVGRSEQKVYINSDGTSDEAEARYLLPDYTFDFSLKKPYYKVSSIRQTLHSGVNILDFGQLQPDFLSLLLNPRELWKLLPFSK